MSKAQELVSLIDSRGGVIGSLVAMDCAAQLRRLEAEATRWQSEYNAALENWQHMQEAFYAEKAKSRELLEEMKWIAVRCPAEILQQEPHKVHWEAAYDAGACARTAIQKHGGQA